MAQPIPRQRSFICTLTTKSEMVCGCCNRQILEDDIIYNIVGGVRVLVLSFHMVTCPGKLASISGNLFRDLAKPFLGWSLIEKWVLTLDTTVLLRRLINWRGRGDTV